MANSSRESRMVPIALGVVGAVAWSQERRMPITQPQAPTVSSLQLLLSRLRHGHGNTPTAEPWDITKSRPLGYLDSVRRGVAPKSILVHLTGGYSKYHIYCALSTAMNYSTSGQTHHRMRRRAPQHEAGFADKQFQYITESNRLLALCT